MEECFKCQRKENEVRIFDVIAGKEIVKMCERCAILEDIPIIKRPTISQLKESEKNYSVYQRLKKMAGLEKKEEKHDESILSRIKKLDENPGLEMPEGTNSLNLVHNFHWYVMRVRRNKGLSQRQLAWALGESEAAIRMIEKGEIPGEPEILIKKIEQFFQIKLRERTEKEIEEEKQKFRESSFLRKRAFERDKQERDENKNSGFEEPVSEIVIDPENKEDIVSSVAYGRTVNTERKETEFMEGKEKTPARILSFEPDKLNELTLSDLQKMKQEREKTEKLIKADSSLWKRDLGEKPEKKNDSSLLEEPSLSSLETSETLVSDSDQKSGISDKTSEKTREKLREENEDEKRKKEIREKIADEMKYEALGRKKEERKSTLGRTELLKKRNYVPSISELLAKKKEKEQMKIINRSETEKV